MLQKPSSLPHMNLVSVTLETGYLAYKHEVRLLFLLFKHFVFIFGDTGSYKIGLQPIKTVNRTLVFNQ